MQFRFRFLPSISTFFRTLRCWALFPLVGVFLHATSGATIIQPSAGSMAAVGQVLAFSGTSTGPGDPETSSVEYRWDFGDQLSATGMNTNHAYAAPGTYKATFTANWTVRTCKRWSLDQGCLSYITSYYTYTADVTVQVLSLPSIQNFSANSNSILQGGSVTLNWSTSNATSLTLTNIGTVTGTSALVYPTGDTTYTLTAANAIGSVSSSLSVSIQPITVSITPASISVKWGENPTFIASANAANHAVTWNCSDGGISNGTYYPFSPGVFTITAISVADPTKSASAYVKVATVGIATPVAVPASGKCLLGGTVSLSALVSGAVDSGVTWSVSGGGTISPSGVFTGTTFGSWTVTATSTAMPSKYSTTLVQVVPILVNVDPERTTIKPGRTQTFSASLTGPGITNSSVVWSVDEQGGGSVSTTGTYTAPPTPGEYSVKATSVQNPACFGVVKVHVPKWVLKWTKDIFYVGGKEVGEVVNSGQAPGSFTATLVDHLGSPRFTWAGGSSPLIEQKFLPFGEALTNPTDVTKFAKGFTNHEQTDASGLIYMQARFYAPWFGRFLSPDPARDQHFEQTQSWNIYSYVQNNPAMKIDPDGKAMQDPTAYIFFHPRSREAFTDHAVAEVKKAAVEFATPRTYSERKVEKGAERSKPLHRKGLTKVEGVKSSHAEGKQTETTTHGVQWFGLKLEFSSEQAAGRTEFSLGGAAQPSGFKIGASGESVAGLTTLSATLKTATDEPLALVTGNVKFGLGVAAGVEATAIPEVDLPTGADFIFGAGPVLGGGLKFLDRSIGPSVDSSTKVEVGEKKE
ncbi:MAG TPA: RHS repeat-associated core domain-containing protein [Holophagaceae bacterium]|nr:RHS repeat-associated core domain-containing protein [Geothrix sp.]HJW32978.1 RHS repeat-associated core domain-containing protein [Holophagaceae bacterium]